MLTEPGSLSMSHDRIEANQVAVLSGALVLRAGFDFRLLQFLFIAFLLLLV